MNKKTKQLYRILIMGASLLIVCVAIAVWWSRARSQPPLLYVTTLPFEPGEYPTGTIAVLDPTRQTCAPPVYLDPTLGDVYRIRLSPQRDQIAYTTYSVTDKSASLWVMKADGSDRQAILLQAPWEPDQANISADGRYVAFIKPKEPREPETAEAWVWNRQDGNTRQVMTGTVQAEWSPRENVMLAYRWTNGRSYLVRAAGTTADDLGPIGGGGIWSPDGRRIAYASDTWVGDASSGHRDFVYEVYILHLVTKYIQTIPSG